MKNALWRSRAVAILGFIAMLLLIFPGLPSPLKTSFLLALVFAVTCLGLAGSRHKAYRPAQSLPRIAPDYNESAPEMVVIESEPVESSEETVVISGPESEEETGDENL